MLLIFAFVFAGIALGSNKVEAKSRISAEVITSSAGMKSFEYSSSKFTWTGTDKYAVLTVEGTSSGWHIYNVWFQWTNGDFDEDAAKEDGGLTDRGVKSYSLKATVIFYDSQRYTICSTAKDNCGNNDWLNQGYVSALKGDSSESICLYDPINLTCVDANAGYFKRANRTIFLAPLDGETTSGGIAPKDKIHIQFRDWWGFNNGKQLFTFTSSDLSPMALRESDLDDFSRSFCKGDVCGTGRANPYKSKAIRLNNSGSSYAVGSCECVAQKKRIIA